MRKPFEKLVLELIRDHQANNGKTIGEIAKALNETPERVLDGLDAVKMLAGRPTYIRVSG